MAETADAIVKATYKRYNKDSGKWDRIYFYTGADQVGETSSLWFLRSSNTVNGKSFTKAGGITLKGDDIPLGDDANTISVTFNSLSFALNSNMGVTESFATTYNAMYNLKAEMNQLRKDIEAVDETQNDKINDLYNQIDDGTIITTGNMAEQITKVGTVSSGTWQGSAIADAYIASASKWDGKQDKLTFDTAPTANSSNPVTSGGIKTAIDTVAAIAQGKTNTYVIDCSDTSVSGNSNASFKIAQTNEDTNAITITDGSAMVTTVNGKTVHMLELKIGDIILTREASIKDWYLGKTGTDGFTFYEIDSDKPDLTDYAKTSAVTSAISAAIGNLDSSKDAGSGKYLQSITITDGKITGGTVGTVPTSLPASNTTSDYSSTGTAPVNGTAVNKALSQTINDSTGSSNGVVVTINGTIQAPKMNVSVIAGSVASGNANVVTGGTVYSHVAARATKIFYADSASSVTGMIDGDICIEYR